MKALTLFFLLISTIALAQETSPEKNKPSYSTDEIKITKEKLIEAKNVEEILDGFPKEYQVAGFRVTLIIKDRDLMEFRFEGNKFTNPIIDEIKLFPIGSKIFIEYIHAKLKSSKSSIFETMPPASFVIVEK